MERIELLRLLFILMPSYPQPPPSDLADIKRAERASSRRPLAEVSALSLPDLHRLLAYVADLELEVDRLRRHNHLVRQEALATLDLIRRSINGAAGEDTDLSRGARHLQEVLDDLRELPGYHPAHDQVITIAIRPVAEQVFRWQQRLQGATDVTLHLELEIEHVEWFPARFRHVLDNLLSNALRYRDPAKTGAWARLAVRKTPGAYEVRVSDNGVGLPPDTMDQVFELIHRAAPARGAALGVGLAVVKRLVEQSGGSLSVDSGPGQGTTFVAMLPRFEVNDFLI